MKQIANDVAVFMTAAKQTIPAKPTIPDAKTRRLRAKLNVDEALEQAVANGSRVGIVRNGETIWLEAEEAFVFDTNDADGKELPVDVTGVVDGAMDQIYVSTGNVLAYGVDPVPCWPIVQAANMCKFGPDGRKDEATGKILKPLNWAEKYDPNPKIAAEIARQTEVGNSLVAAEETVSDGQA